MPVELLLVPDLRMELPAPDVEAPLAAACAAALEALRMLLEVPA